MDIRRRIQNLLALGRGTDHEHEAYEAMAKARALMVQHNLAMADVEMFSGEDDYITTKIDPVLRRTGIRNPLMIVLERAFFVKTFHSKSHTRDSRNAQWTVGVFGDKHNVDIAIHAYEQLKQVFQKLWKERKQELPGATPIDASGYWLGLAHGFASRIEREDARRSEEESTALVVIDNKLSTKFGDAYPHLRETNGPQVNRRAYFQGIEDSRKINIRKGVDVKDEERGLLRMKDD